MILGFGTIGGVMRRVHRKLEEEFTQHVRSLATAQAARANYEGGRLASAAFVVPTSALIASWICLPGRK